MNANGNGNGANGNGNGHHGPKKSQAKVPKPKGGKGSGKSNKQPLKKKDGPGAPKGSGRTSAEEQLRIDYALRLIGMCAYKSEMKDAFREKFGPLSARQIETYISRARDELKAARGEKAGEVADELVAFHRGVMRDVTAPHNARVRSAQALADLLGVNAATDVNLKVGGKLGVELSGRIEIVTIDAPEDDDWKDDGSDDRDD